MIVNILSFISALIIILIRPIYFIRIGPFSNKIGHTAINTFVEIIKNKDCSKILYYYDQKTSLNTALLKFFKTKILILPYDNFLKKTLTFSIKITKSNSHQIIRFKAENSDWVYSKILFNKNDLKFFFKDEILKLFNLSYDDKWICIHNRDDAYDKKYSNKIDVNKNKYRNAKITNYYDLIHYAIKKNYKIIRIGKIQEEKISIINQSIIDLPFDDRRTDFNELFFISHCSFFIGCDTGITNIATIFKKNVIWTNWPELDYLFQNYKSMEMPILPKIIRDNNNKIIKFSDYRKLNIYKNEDGSFEDFNNFNFIENTSEEILLTFQECIGFLNNKQNYYSNYQRSFMEKIYLSYYNEDTDFKKIKIKFPLFFIKKYKEQIL